jgi:hypothetical protein
MSAACCSSGRVDYDQRFSLTGQNRCIAQRDDRGDNLSVRFYIQNSISLTIAALQRIFDI